MTEWATTLQHMALWGPGLVILWGAYKLVNAILGILKQPPAFVGQFIAAQDSQAVAMAQMASAVQMMATRQDSLEYLRTQKLDEVLVGQQLIMGKIEAFERKTPHGSG